MKCLRCNGEMEHLGHESLQLGQYGFFTGHLSNLFSGALEVDVYACKAVIEELHKDIGEPYNEEEEMEQLVEQFTRIRMKHDPFFFFAGLYGYYSHGTDYYFWFKWFCDCKW